MKIWAHRGCSQRYPENTIMAFSKAMEICGLTGIELDIQMTKDGEIVVIHDERVDRTTDGIGYVKDLTYAQIRKLGIEGGKNSKEKIPSINEVLDLMQEEWAAGLLLNIELKNSIVPYEDMEEKIYELINKRGMRERIIYSSFYTLSLEKIRTLDTEASIGILDTRVSDCFYKKGGLSKMNSAKIALHPFNKGMDLNKERLHDQTVRAWFAGHLYPEEPTGRKLDLNRLEEQGITDVFLNEPEVYLD